MKPNIAILFGGRSPEYPVSLSSASAVIQHLNREMYNPILIGISRQGEWFRYYGPVERIAADTWHNPANCVPALISPNPSLHGVIEFWEGRPQTTPLDGAFPVLHGQQGEDGTVQGLLELAGIPIIGCGLEASALCMDKDVAHRLAAQAGVPVPPSVVVRRWQPLAEALAAAQSLTYPLFVKPARAGSSFGVTKVLTANQLPQALTDAFQYDDKALIEQAVPGVEVGCAILGQRQNLITGEPDQIELAQGFFDYQEKYTLATAAIRMPAPVDPATKKRLQQTALLLYNALECQGCARVDLFLTPSGDIFFPRDQYHSRFYSP